MLEKLLKGHQRFLDGYYKENSERLKALAEKQTPEIAMVSCCDSRVDPSILFDLEPGDIFIVRNVANLVPPYEIKGEYHGTSAALEFAVTGLMVKQIIILGHANCGGIRALIEENSDIKQDGFINNWIQIAAAAKEEVLARSELKTVEQQIDACEKTAIRYSMDNLMTYPWIKARVEAGELELIGCYYDLHSGELMMIDKMDAEKAKENE